MNIDRLERYHIDRTYPSCVFVWFGFVYFECMKYFKKEPAQWDITDYIKILQDWSNSRLSEANARLFLDRFRKSKYKPDSGLLWSKMIEIIEGARKKRNEN